MRTVDVTLTQEVYPLAAAFGGGSCRTVVLQSLHSSVREKPPSSRLLSLPQDLLEHIRAFLPLFPDRVRLCQVNRAQHRTAGWAETLHLCCRKCEPCQAGEFNRCMLGLLHLPFKRLQTVVSQSASSLKHLILAGSDLTDTQLLQLMPHLGRLETLDLSCCRKLTDASLLALGGLSSLRRLSLRDLTGLTDVSLQSLAPRLHKLEVLVLLGCGRLTDAGVVCLVDLRATLKVLNLWGVHNLSDAGVSVLADRMHNLEELNIRYCHRLTDRSMAKVTSQLTSLRYLNVRYCPRISDATMLSLSTKMTGLQTLNLSHCHRLTDATMEAITTHPSLGQSLRVLRLWECRGISRDSLLTCLRRLSTHAPHLCFIDIRNCLVSTDDALAAMNHHHEAASHCGSNEDDGLDQQSPSEKEGPWMMPVEGRLSRGPDAYRLYGTEKQSAVSPLAHHLA